MNAAVCAATARSGASAKTMFGPLPPHSVHTGFMFDSAEYFMKSLPTSVEPVNPTTSMSGCRPMASPTAGPPVTTLSTPSGRPASCASSAKRSAESEVCSSGFSTTLLPAASAGGTFQPSRPIGQFQGSTAPTTPTGSLVISASTDRSVGATSS